MAAREGIGSQERKTLEAVQRAQVATLRIKNVPRASRPQQIIAAAVGASPPHEAGQHVAEPNGDEQRRHGMCRHEAVQFSTDGGPGSTSRLSGNLPCAIPGLGCRPTCQASSNGLNLVIDAIARIPNAAFVQGVAPTLRIASRCRPARIQVVDKLVDGMGLEAFVGKVDHHPVLLGIAAHDNLAALGINDNALHIRNQAQRPLESRHAACVVQARDLQPESRRHCFTLRRVLP